MVMVFKYEDDRDGHALWTLVFLFCVYHQPSLAFFVVAHVICVLNEVTHLYEELDILFLSNLANTQAADKRRPISWYSFLSMRFPSI